MGLLLSVNFDISFLQIVFHVGLPFVAGYGYNSLGFAQSNPYKRRVSTLDRKMQHLDTTMASLAHLTAAPPAALYNPLDHGRNLTKEGSSSRQKTKSSSRMSSRVKVARAN